MRRDLLTSALAIVVLTLVLGLGYGLAVTGVAQVVFPGRADGSLLHRDGRVIGSRLIGQSFAGRPGYFQSRPSATDYAADASAFANAGPNSRDVRAALERRMTAYLARERPYNPGLTRRDVPVDAVTTSASGLDPHISVANARLQAARVARIRGLTRQQVTALVDSATQGRGLGLLGERGVNVVELNLAVDREQP